MVELKVTINKENLTQYILSSAESLKLKLDYSDEHKFVFLKKASLFSYGNMIEIHLNKVSDCIILQIQSSSKNQIQLIDWGTNEEIENSFLKEIKSHIHK